jgi:phosphohistidine phosphatase
MNLYLMRHGLAVAPGYDSDHQRPLTTKGKRKIKRVADAFAALDLVGDLDLVLSSPLIRARQTAIILRAQWKMRRKLELCEELAPGANPTDLINLLLNRANRPKDVLLVGHEPDLGQLASFLLTGEPNLLPIVFKKGGVAKLNTKRLRAGRCASLEWLLSARQLERMA